MQFLTATSNLPFAIALALMAMLGLVQVISLLTGGLDLSSNHSDAATPELPDAPATASWDADHSINHAFLYSILGWLQIGKIPTMVVFILLLMTFGISGLLLQKGVQFATGNLLPATLASIPALLISMVATGVFGRWLALILPKDETEALSEESFLGLPAVIVQGTAARNKPAQAKFQDRHGRTHYAMVEPQNDNETFAAGEEVQLILRKGACFFVIANPFALERSTLAKRNPQNPQQTST